MKKIITLIITLSMILSCAIIPAHANNDITVELNGEEIYFDQPPIVQNGRTLVPMRAIFEAMGCDVEWYNGVIDVYKDNECFMTLWIDDNEMWTLEKDYFMIDVPPQIVNDRTLVPVRVISESMGATVEWNGTSKIVSITYQNNYVVNSYNCNHYSTQEVCLIDLRTFEYTGDEAYHNVIDIIEITCDNCGEKIRQTEKRYEDKHKYENSVCTACGYNQKKGLSLNQACSHNNTRRISLADSAEYESRDADTHSCSILVTTYCDDCGKELSRQTETTQSSHIFNGNNCEFCGYIKSKKEPSISVNTGNLDIDDDGNYKILHLKSGESFIATNHTAKSFNINVEKNDYAKYFHYVVYKEDGNIDITKYNQSISSYGNRTIKSGYSIGIYNPNEYTIDIKAPSDVFYPEAQKAFETVTISPKNSIEIENTSPTSFDTLIIGNKYDAKQFDYVIYKNDGNVATSKYNQIISTYGNRQIKPGYVLSIYNNNNDSIEVIKPSKVGNIKQTNAFNIINLNAGESCRIENTIKTEFDILVRSNGNAKKFDYTLYDEDSNATSAKYNQSISTYGNRQIKPNYSIIISNPNDTPIAVYVPYKVSK